MLPLCFFLPVSFSFSSSSSFLLSLLFHVLFLLLIAFPLHILYSYLYFFLLYQLLSQVLCMCVCPIFFLYLAVFKMIISRQFYVVQVCVCECVVSVSFIDLCSIRGSGWWEAFTHSFFIIFSDPHRRLRNHDCLFVYCLETRYHSNLQTNLDHRV